MEWDIDETTGQKVQCEEKPVMSMTLYWCSECNIPMYEECCPECGSKGRYIATDIRPVFPEEKVLLALLLDKENPLCFENLSVWNNTNDDLLDKLPLAYRGRYDFYNVETNGLLWIAIQPQIKVGLVTLRKDRAQIEKLANLNCAIFLDETSFYIKEKLMDEGIPFVLVGKQVYLPFIGFLLSNTNERDIAPVHLISYLTQKLLLTAMYEKWNNVTVSEAARRLNVSKMSISRCFDELEYLNVDVLGMKGKSRVINVPSDTKKLWEQVESVLRNPVIARYELQEDIKLVKKAGISALCEYSLLSDNDYPTYAVMKKEMTEVGIKRKKHVRTGEEIGCVVLELGYFIDYENKSLEDPFSVALSLTEAEKQDERVKISIKEMLEEYVW